MGLRVENGEHAPVSTPHDHRVVCFRRKSQRPDAHREGILLGLGQIPVVFEWGQASCAARETPSSQGRKYCGMSVTSLPPTVAPLTILAAAAGFSGKGARTQRGALYQCGARAGFCCRASVTSLASMADACNLEAVYRVHIVQRPALPEGNGPVDERRDLHGRDYRDVTCEVPPSFEGFAMTKVRVGPSSGRPI